MDVPQKSINNYLNCIVISASKRYCASTIWLDIIVFSFLKGIESNTK